MSIASKLTTLNTLVNNIKAKLRAWNRLPTPGPSQPDPHGLEDCWTAINNISGTQYITNTNVVHVVANGKVDAQVSDTNLTPNNIVSGVTILGVTGTGGGTPSHLNTDLLTINYGTADSIDKTTMAYDVNLDYFTGVKLEIYPDSNPNKTLKPENIKYGTTVLGVTGNYIGTTGVADLRSTGNPASWNTAREVVTIDLDETVSGFSSSNILSLCGYNITMGNYPSGGSFSAFDGKISSFYIIGANTSKAVLVDYNNEKLVPTDVPIDCYSYDGQRIYIKISNESALFMGAYMIALVYSK